MTTSSSCPRERARVGRGAPFLAHGAAKCSEGRAANAIAISSRRKPSPAAIPQAGRASSRMYRFRQPVRCGHERVGRHVARRRLVVGVGVSFVGVERLGDELHARADAEIAGRDTARDHLLAGELDGGDRIRQRRSTSSASGRRQEPDAKRPGRRARPKVSQLRRDRAQLRSHQTLKARFSRHIHCS